MAARKPDHDRRHGAQQRRLGDPALAILRHIARHLAAAGGVADVDRIAQLQVLGHRRDIGGVGVHVVAGPGLVRAPVTAPVVGDHPVAVLEEEQHLAVPVVGAQWPAMVEHDRLAGAPILVEDLGPVACGDRRHLSVFLAGLKNQAAQDRPHRRPD
jgi:hypothetical protein